MFSNNMNNMIINQRYLASSASVYTEATSASRVCGATQTQKRKNSLQEFLSFLLVRGHP